ncbi:inositol monophosphatase [Candidatus Saccharibacteria bacterium]|nr:inositol monophosphatase [Candidatus Saccharibacteria bacterium]
MLDEKKKLSEMEKIAHICGEAMIRRHTDDLIVNEKSSNRDLVTQVDLQNQNRIVQYLSEQFPEVGFYSEETAGDILPDNEYVFVIDPIDGTTNFTKEMHFSCVSIACFKNRKPFIGVVYDPYHDEMFKAVLNGGAFLNGVPIHVSDKPLEKSLVAFGTAPYFPEVFDNTMLKLKQIFAKCSDVRRMGAAALDLCYLAAGRFSLFFEERISLWDFAAGALIVAEAGGEVCQLNGKPLTFGAEKTSIIAGKSDIIRESGLLD